MICWPSCRHGALLAVLGILVVLHAGCSHAVQFDISPGAEFCLWEKVGHNALVTGEYNLAYSGVTRCYMKVADPDDEIIWTNEDASTGTLAFTSGEAGLYKVCFLDMGRQGIAANPQQRRRVTFEIKSGAAALDYDEVAKKEHLEPLALELRKLEDLVKSVNQDFQYLRNRERNMRDTNESTNSRVAWFSAISVAILVGMSAWQIVHLKNFRR